MMKCVGTFGERLKQARIRKGYSSQGLSKLCEFGVNYVSNVETGTIPDPSISKAAKLASELGVSLDWLAGLTD